MEIQVFEDECLSCVFHTTDPCQGNFSLLEIKLSVPLYVGRSRYQTWLIPFHRIALYTHSTQMFRRAATGLAIIFELQEFLFLLL